nr:DNA-processing protein DprA [Cryobacterium sp. M91]
MDIVGGLVGRGHTIVSGAAYGIDGMAHRTALASNGQTVAYLAGGVDRFYPTGHDALLTRIATDGVVASEMETGLSSTHSAAENEMNVKHFAPSSRPAAQTSPPVQGRPDAAFTVDWDGPVEGSPYGQNFIQLSRTTGQRNSPLL